LSKTLQTEYGEVTIKGRELTGHFVVDGDPQTLVATLNKSGNDFEFFSSIWDTPRPCGCELNHDGTWHSGQALRLSLEILRALRASGEVIS